MSEQLDPCGLTYDECASLARTYGDGNQAKISLIVANADRLRAARMPLTDWRTYHSALSRCAELLDNMADEAPLVDAPKYLAAKLATPAAAAPQQAVPEGRVLMPKRLTAENGAKSLFMGEFKEQITVECPECNGDAECHVCAGEGSIQQDIYVEWDTIKRIYALAVMNFAAPVAAIEQPPELLDALNKYADRDNWVEDERGIRRIWMEPDSSSPMEYHGFTLAEQALRTQPPADTKPLTRCAAARDGDCTHFECPQLRDDEPRSSGRHCPLDTDSEDD